MILSSPRAFALAFLSVGLLAAPSGLAQTASQIAVQDSTAGRSGAMRAPLNIVPPVMQQALGAQPKAQTGNEKLAPRVAARQSKRAVRAVAVAPGSGGEIVQVGQLGALQDAPIGLEDGFGSNLWQGARLAFITGQMARLPERIDMAALRHAELTLYRSTTASPVGTVDGTSWYGARLTRFLALGDTGSVLQLEGLTGGAAQDAYAAQAVALAHFGRGDAAAACALPRPQRTTRGHADTLAFFMQLLVYCQLRIGEFEKAGLTLELNEKSLGDDRFFRDLAFLMAAQAQPVFGTAEDAAAAKQAKQDVPLVVPSELTPMQLALLQLAGRGLTVPLDQLPPYFAAALAKDYAQPTAMQLGAALMAVRAGTLTAERFSQMSQLADLSAYQNVPVAASGAAALRADAPPAVFLADALLKVDMALPEDQPAALAEALRAAHDRGMWSDMVRVLADRLQELAAALPTAENGPTDALTGALTDNSIANGPAALSSAVSDEPVSAVAAADAAARAVPIVGAGDRAVLLPAFLALAAPSEPAALPAAFAGDENRLVARLRGYPQINNPAQDPLADLLASLPDAGAAPDDLKSADAVNAAPEATTNAASPDAGPSLAAVSLSDTASLPLPEANGAPADTRPHPIADWSDFEAQYESVGAAGQKYLTRELAVYQGLGFEVAEGFQILPDEAATAQARFDKLADNKWIGDLLLALVDRYAGVSAAALSESDIVALLSVMRRAGLEATAHALGAEILLQAAADLSMVAPQSFDPEPR